ncbi:MAG TPA: class I SAM-dependent methyltransferase [Nitrosopumilaceae archaeon]|nr:class I SAM-dependent methyltransferase [Nitrosopumilaceae archaeon]
MNDDYVRIKNKIMSSDPSRYWGDDFDVRFYLVSKLKKLYNKSVLDVGGGIGIISSELDKSNFRINVDSSFCDLKTCRKKMDQDIQNICASMTHLPFIDNSFDSVICSHVLEIAKHFDIEKNQMIIDNSIIQYPTVETTLKEISRVLNSGGKLFLTTPNNTYYKSTKLNYHELKRSISNYFARYSLSFYNTFPRLSRKHRKLNLANILPKLMSNVISKNKLITTSLIKEDRGTERESVSFYLEAYKN